MKTLWGVSLLWFISTKDYGVFFIFWREKGKRNQTLVLLFFLFTMMNKTLLLLGMGLVSIGLLSPASATQRYLNSDGMPNYSQLSSNTNGNQLSASMWDGLVAGLNTTSSRFFQLVTAINQSLTELSTRQEQHFSQVKTQMSSMDAYLRAHLPVQCSTGATPDPINGKCGTQLRTCNSWTSLKVNNTNACGESKIWHCHGINGGNSTSCEIANPSCPVVQPINGQCGSYSLKCNRGNMLLVDSRKYGSSDIRTGYTWHCQGINGGKTVSCNTKTGY